MSDKVQTLIRLLKDDLRWSDVDSATDDQRREFREMLAWWHARMKQLGN